MINFLVNLKNNKIFRFTVYILIFLYVLGTLFILAKAITYPSTVNRLLPNDFIPYYTGASIIKEDPKNLYDFQVQHDKQDELVNVENNTYLQFVYPPVAAYALLPLTFVDLKTANLIWLTINAFVLGLLFIVIINYFKNYNWWLKIALIVFIIIFYPTYLTLGLGQISILVGLVLFSSWILYNKNKDFLSGLLLSIFFIKPQYLPLPFLAIIASKNIKMLFGFLTGIIGMLLLSILPTGITGFYKYIIFIQEYSTKVNEFTRTIISMVNIQSLTTFYFGYDNEIGNMVYVSFSLIIIVTVIYTWYTKIKKSDFRSNLRWGILIISMLLISPHTNHQDIFLIIIAFMILIPKNAIDLEKISNRIKFLIFSLLPASYILLSYSPYIRTLYILYLLIFIAVLTHEIRKEQIKLKGN